MRETGGVRIDVTSAETLDGGGGILTKPNIAGAGREEGVNGDAFGAPAGH